MGGCEAEVHCVSKFVEELQGDWNVVPETVKRNGGAFEICLVGLDADNHDVPDAAYNAAGG